jgi:hypothetical protein
MVAGIEHVVRSAQNGAASGHNVRSERSPLHDVRQHATCTSAQGGAYACANSFSDEPTAHSRTSIEMESLQADRITAGGARRDRTDDLLLAKQALSQLSYGPKSVGARLRQRASAGNLRSAKVGGPGKI